VCNMPYTQRNVQDCVTNYRCMTFVMQHEAHFPCHWRAKTGLRTGTV